MRAELEAQAEALLKHEPEQSEHQFQLGEEVLVRWSHLPGQEGAAKQYDRYGGPYLVARRIAPGAYQLRGLPKGTPDIWNQDRLKSICTRAQVSSNVEIVTYSSTPESHR